MKDTAMRRKSLRTSLVLQGAVLAVLGQNAVAAPPAGSAYFTDAQESHVQDASSRGLQLMNMLTCIMNALRPDAMINKGQYVAFIDPDKCDSRVQTEGGSGGAGDTPTYGTSLVESSRESNEAPMRVKSWIATSPDSGEQIVYANTSATAVPSTTAPYGVFRLDYCEPAISGGCAMQGYLEAGVDGLSLYEQEDQSDGETHTTALRLSSVSSTSGSGRLQLDRGNDQMAFDFAYDATHFRRASGGADQCFARDASDPDTGLSAWRYGLYDATTGARIQRNSGFPVEYSHGNDTYRGFLSHWGLSLPEAANATLTDGATLTRVEYVAGADEPTRTDYTLVHAGGRLTQHAKHTRTLKGIDKIRFDAWVGDATGFYTGAESNAQYTLYWDDAAGSFKAAARQTCGMDGRCTMQALEPEPPVAASYFASMGGVRGWSQVLGGDLYIDLQGMSGAIVSDTTQVIYRSQTLVYPADMPATLHCLRDCPTSASLAAFFADGSTAESPFAAGSSVEPVTYSISTGSALLKDAEGQPVVYTDRNALERSESYSRGVQSGMLFTNLSAAECPDMPGQYCEWQIGSQDVYYTWQTGADPWNQFSAVKDGSGQFVELEAPLQVSYQVPEGARYGEFAGKAITLEYAGFGNLWGIPQTCVSAMTNAPVSCESDEDDVRPVSDFVIPVNATTGRVSAGDTQYLVKWLNREIRLASKPFSECAALPLPDPGAVTLPTAADLRNPANPQSEIYIGAKPALTSAPRVIQGEVMY
jgi:hypothetical protein